MSGLEVGRAWCVKNREGWDGIRGERLTKKLLRGEARR